MRFRTLLFFALAPILAVAQTDADRLYKLFADYHENRLRETPELATSLGRNEYNHLWTDWSPAAQERRRAEIEKYLRDLETYLAFYTETYAPKAHQSTSMSDLPNGANYYAMSVRTYTTTQMTPQAIHELGQRAVKRIEAEMENIAAETGFHGTLDEFERKLANSPEFLFHGRQEMLVYCRNAALIAEPGLPRLFKRLPRMPFGVRAIPEDREASTASHYIRPATDGSRGAPRVW